MKLDMFDLQSCVVEHLWSIIIVLLFISRRLQTQLEAFKTAEAASKQTKVFIVLFSLFDFFFISEGNLKREI